MHDPSDLVFFVEVHEPCNAAATRRRFLRVTGANATKPQPLSSRNPRGPRSRHLELTGDILLISVNCPSTALDTAPLSQRALAPSVREMKAGAVHDRNA